MRVIITIKTTQDSEAGVLPSERLLPDERLLTTMGQDNEDLVKTGLMLTGEGLQPSSKGVHARSPTRSAR